MHILITGAAGFIGSHLAKRFVDSGFTVMGIDNLNDYYAPSLKRDRLDNLSALAGFSFVELDFSDSSSLVKLFEGNAFTHVVHLGAQAGVRYSLVNPAAYIQSNLVGFANILECCRSYQIQHLVYASSSSVYGLNACMPYSTEHCANHPVSLYGATKQSNEKMAHAYSHLYGIPSTGLRFFTVYGPWGRPDMSPFLFTDAIIKSQPISVFNQGKMLRDFTYIDDIVESIVRIAAMPASPDPNWQAANPSPASSSAPFAIYNIGNSQPVPLMDFIHEIEDKVGIKAKLDLLPMQPGDVEATFADCSPLEAATGFRPRTALADGVKRYVDWHLGYYN